MTIEIFRLNRPFQIRPDARMRSNRPTIRQSICVLAGQATEEVACRAGQRRNRPAHGKTARKRQHLRGMPPPVLNGDEPICELLVYRPDDTLAIIVAMNCASENTLAQRAEELRLLGFRVEVGVTASKPRRRATN